MRNAEEKSCGGKFKFGSTAVLLVYYYIMVVSEDGVDAAVATEPQ